MNLRSKRRPVQARGSQLFGGSNVTRSIGLSKLNSQSIVLISEITQVGEARRRALQAAAAAGFNETDCGKAAIIASELATNQARYATGGEIHLSTYGGTGRCLDIVAIDRGPGIENVARSLTDGYSTGGTSGTGLGAAQRLATEFEIFSTQPKGTVIVCRLRDDQAKDDNTPFKWGVASRPAPHETVSGDSWSIAKCDGQLAISMVDGLGHGPEAAAAAAQAISAFESDPFRTLPAICELSHTRMRGTRGGALAVAHLDVRAATLKYVGVGNIAGHLRAVPGETGRGLFSHNGTVGVQIRKIQEFIYECPDEGLLVMHSDGLQTRWSLEAYPGLAFRHPAAIAAVLYRDFTRGKDDVTVAVVRISSTHWLGRHAA
jgi:anti-sigma regulatory factor (Ser/Thr protein kinase)